MESNFQSVANRSPSVAMTDRKQRIIDYLEVNNKCKTSDLIELIGLSDGRIRTLLREMVSEGTLEKTGNNRYTLYSLKDS